MSIQDVDDEKLLNWFRQLCDRSYQKHKDVESMPYDRSEARDEIIRRMSDKGAMLYPTKQQLIDVGLNVFAADLLAESLLSGLTSPEASGINFFLAVNRRDVPLFKGLNFRLEPVPKEKDDGSD
jgi:hypothetical protein